ncbi:MAG: DUF6788 family protein [Egibacteraceae bacterium]
MSSLAGRDTDPRMLPGSLITLRRKCGKANCRCASSAAHETPALKSYSVAGGTKILILAADEVPAGRGGGPLPQRGDRAGGRGARRARRASGPGDRPPGTAVSAATAGEPAGFAVSRERFELVVGWLDGEEAARLTHGEQEQLQVAARELFRQLLADHLDLRARNETRLETVADADGVPRGSVEAGHCRTLATVFGEVTVERLAYRQRRHANLHPAAAALSLPAEKHSKRRERRG